jgi:hypothetical protein
MTVRAGTHIRSLRMPAEMAAAVHRASLRAGPQPLLSGQGASSVDIGGNRRLATLSLHRQLKVLIICVKRASNKPLDSGLGVL